MPIGEHPDVPTYKVIREEAVARGFPRHQSCEVSLAISEPPLVCFAVAEFEAAYSAEQREIRAECRRARHNRKSTGGSNRGLGVLHVLDGLWRDINVADPKVVVNAAGDTHNGNGAGIPARDEALRHA